MAKNEGGVVVLAGMTTLAIVPKKACQATIWEHYTAKQFVQIDAIQIVFPILRHYAFLLASVRNLFADIHGYFAMEERNA